MVGDVDPYKARTGNMGSWTLDSNWYTNKHHSARYEHEH